MKASGGKDKSVKIWDPDTCKFIYSFEGHRDSVSVSLTEVFVLLFELFLFH
jgi:hypothetical protein